MMQKTMASVETVEEAMPAGRQPDRLELKAERVQESFARQLGWSKRKGVPGIHRSRKFHSAGEAAAYAVFALQLAGRRGQPVTVSQAGRKVTIALTGRPGRGVTAGLTDSVYTLASALG